MCNAYAHGNMDLTCIFLLCIHLTVTVGDIPMTGGDLSESGSEAGADLSHLAPSYELQSPLREQSGIYNEDYYGHLFPKRQKRAARIIGTLLTWFGRNKFKQVLIGARLMHTAEGIKWYLKTGGYRKAVSDFYSMKPKNVQKLVEGIGFAGFANGRKIAVLYRVADSKLPLLCIYRKSGTEPETVIKYMDEVT